MLRLDIPGWGTFPIRHLVLDLNGTLALGGVLMHGVEERIRALAGDLDIHILTADTFGRAKELVRDLPVNLQLIPEREQIEAKGKFISGLPLKTAAMGNGRNDMMMLKEADLGIAVVGPEGAAAETLALADIVVRDTIDGLDLLLNPVRLKATLRS
ncbi:MAG: ATPase P [bacterium]|nr:MAG: ATPase P [bacterium]